MRSRKPWQRRRRSDRCRRLSLGRAHALRHGARFARLDESRRQQARQRLESACRRPRNERRRFLDGRDRGDKLEIQTVRVLGARLHNPRTPRRPRLWRQRSLQDRGRPRRQSREAISELEQAYSLAQRQRRRAASHRERIPHQPHNRPARTRPHAAQLPLRNLQPHRGRQTQEPPRSAPSRIQHRQTGSDDKSDDIERHCLDQRRRRDRAPDDIAPPDR